MDSSEEPVSDLGKYILKTREQQNETFISKIQPRNRKEAKIIITRYDLKNSILEALDFKIEWNENVEKIKKMLEERSRILSIISDYL